MHRILRSIHLVFLFYLITLSVASAETKKRVAVLEFDGVGIQENVLTLLADSAREASRDYLSREEYTIYTRQNLQKILRDNELDPNCEEGECAVDTARNIGADFAITGSLMKMDSRYILTLSLYDAESGEFLSSKKIEAAKEFDLIHAMTKKTVSLLAEGLGHHNANLARASIRQEILDRGLDIKNVDTGKYGFLTVRTEPPGAEVFINGKSLGATPKSGTIERELPEGSYIVVAEMGEIYHPASSEKIGVGDDQSKEVTLRLQPAFAPLSITSSPSGAGVFLNGERVGKTPFKQRQQPSGSYDLRVELDNYTPVREHLVISDGDSKQRSYKLSKSVGDLSVESSPSGASIWLNGSPTSKITPYTFKEKKPDVYRVKLQLDKHKPKELRVNVEAGKTNSQKLKLDPNYGNLRVESETPAATIQLNGKRLSQKTPHTLTKLDAGVARVKLMKPGYSTSEVKIGIPDDGSTVKVSPPMIPILGTISVQAVDPGGNPCKGVVFLDDGETNKKLGITPLARDVLALPYVIRFEGQAASCEGMKAKQEVTVQHNQREKLELKVNAYSYSDRQKSRGALTRNYLLDAALLGSSVYFAAQAGQSYNAMQSAFGSASAISDPNDSAKYSQYLDEGNAQLQTFNISAAVTSTLVALCTTHYFLSTRRAQNKHNHIVDVMDKY